MNMHKFFNLAVLIGFCISNSVLACETAFKETISCKDLRKTVSDDCKSLIFDVVVLNNSGSIESKLIFKMQAGDIYSRGFVGRDYRENAHSMVQHYNDKSMKGKAILRHCYDHYRAHYWDIVYYHCDKEKEEFQNLLRTYVSNIRTGKGCLLGGLPVCAYEVHVDIPSGNVQFAMALVPVLGWIAVDLLHHVGMVVQANNGKWYVMQKERSGTNTMAQYDSFAEARDRIYRTCNEGTPGRKWFPCSPPTPISTDALEEFNANYNTSYDLLNNNCKDYVSAFEAKFNLTSESVDCKRSDGSWYHICSCKKH